MAAVTAETSTCRLCPPGGGTVVAWYPGDAPAAKASARAHREAQETGLPHHDHYDPVLDAFVVVRHEAPAGGATAGGATAGGATAVPEIPGQAAAAAG
ncbi:hypothetical protein [Peterkaempfera bronchialis]|uniref:hypothetical protein n=1 Tax=Peterkaempfera bronchialis TaxID=2126346 RepID=UPI003C2FB9E7